MKFLLLTIDIYHSIFFFFISPQEIGIGNTSAWKFCGINPKTSAAIYFEVASQQQSVQPGSRGLIQFTTHYQHANGSFRLRVTTVARKYVIVFNSS